MMVSSASNTQQIRDRLIEVYRNLSSLEQTMVQLFSVIYEPISRSLFVACWEHLSENDRERKRFTSANIKAYLDRLIQKEVLVQPNEIGPQCHPLLAEIATRDAVKAKRFERLVHAVQMGFPVPRRWKDGPIAFTNERQLIREIRLGIYRNDIHFINKQLEAYYKYSYQKEQISLVDILLQTCNNPFEPEWFRLLAPKFYDIVLVHILNSSIMELTPTDAAFLMLQEDVGKAGQQSSLVQIVFLMEQFLLRGQLQEAQQLLEQNFHQSDTSFFWGFVLFLQGNDIEAIAHYESELQAHKSNPRKPKVFFEGMSGLIFILALLTEGSPESLKAAIEYANIGRHGAHWLRYAYATLAGVVQVLRGDLSQRDWLLNLQIAPYDAGNCLETLICSLCLYWVDAERAKNYLPGKLEPFYEAAEAAGYLWVAKAFGDLVFHLQPRHPIAKRAAALLPDVPWRSLAGLIQPQEPWELCLNALSNLRKAETPKVEKPAAPARLAWMLTIYGKNWTLQPREQTLSAKGEWGKGRPIALKRLKTNIDEFSYLTYQDRQICSHIKAYTYGWNGKTEYSFNERAIILLVGHPYVFWDDAPTTRVEVVKGQPELLVKKSKGDLLTLQFSPQLKDNTEVLVAKESPTRLKVIEITPEHRRIAAILGEKNRLEVPMVAKERVLNAVNAVSSIVTVHSDIGGGVATEEVPFDPKPHIHLLPANTGLKVAVLTRPFAVGGPYYRPGTGGETVIAEIEGKRLQTTRNLKEEKKLANAAIAACQTLAQQDSQDNEWLIEDPEACLELLLELQTLGDQVIVEHPEGEKFRVARQVGLKDFQMVVKRQNDWFATDGQVRISNEQVLNMQQLLQLLEKTPGRFIPLADGQFLALTQEFRKRLDELRSYADRSSKGLRLHPLAALAVEDWMDEVGELKVDKHWKNYIQRLKDSQNFEPQLSSTLQADLRDYQIDGFRWLARLAHWGVGACLADDMGLGKTLQALALILTRASAGPTLIIAPTSVGMNWLSEAQRFAPTLNPIQFGSGNRQKMLDQLQPFDLLVCSYGLLQQEDVAEMLAKVQWQTIVLDEAQSIKNFATKRSQAAMNLQGCFKLITTGTPIENHLGELWNLFRFINPGLLGSLDSFNERFAIPIERYGDRLARARLKKLIQPFLLRRTKNQVLEELPSRTEILLQVELSKEELAFYEALRREAIAKLAESDATAGAKHLQVLAEIMRLRRACCNTQLVNPNITLTSSKLQLFSEVMTELLENKHKALVFSQFVDHLHIIRDYLDSQKISYQYLDGSTSTNERKKRVNAFQSGDGDVFLISLKAGGVGLNLTAADYVIHMDPWWNPAVEDQASDRAHRIGQQRPVTIYRLVAKNTIEEKIVALHQHKRDLADSLLEGTEMSGKISTDELLRLIAEG